MHIEAYYYYYYYDYYITHTPPTGRYGKRGDAQSHTIAYIP